MNTTTLPLPAKFPPEVKDCRAPIWSWSCPQCLVSAGESALYFLNAHIFAPLAGAVLGSLRALGLTVIFVLALADAFCTYLIAMRAAGRLARASASWFHRWSRAMRFVFGLRTTVRGHVPVSGMVVAHYTSLLDALVLAALHPCVFVAGEELRRRPLLGLLARFGGTIFVRSSRRVDLQLATFAIERAVLRRQIVVLFPECNPQRSFATALFQAASELGCTLTATAIGYGASPEGAGSAPTIRLASARINQLTHIIKRRRNPVTVAFDGPRFHRGGRKDLARQLNDELLALAPAVVH